MDSKTERQEYFFYLIAAIASIVIVLLLTVFVLRRFSKSTEAMNINTQDETVMVDKDASIEAVNPYIVGTENQMYGSGGLLVADNNSILTLINPEYSIPDDWNVDLVDLINDQTIDRRAYEDLQNMMDDCRAAGLHPLICSSYRTHEKQIELFENKIDRLIDEGYTEEHAKIEAAKWVAVPGTSEHELGLALDIVDESYQELDAEQANTDVQIWLMQNSYKYGFILRYPADKVDITEISYEPWHYRYVGKDAAAYIYENGICLEEYLTAR